MTWRRMTPCVLIIVCLFMTLPCLATVSVVGGLPPGAIISVDNDGISNGATRVTPPGGAAFHIKGNSFTLANTLDITSVTVRVDDEQTIVDGDGSFTLDFYNIDGIPDDTQATGNTPIGASLYTQTDPVSGISISDYLKISLNAPLTLGPGVFGFAISTGDMELFLDIRNDADNGAYTEGELIRNRIDTGVWQDRNFDMVFAIEAVPEPASGVLGLFGLLFLLRRLC